jgi:hypothetical protein
MYVMYVPNGEKQQRQLSISFLPNGEIDMSHTTLADMNNANSLLEPTIRSLQNVTGNSMFDIWKLANWIFVSDYWLTLYDLGQITPGDYDTYTVGDGNFAPPVFSRPVMFPSTNNIFVNDSLFQIYQSTLQHTILPLIRVALPETSLSEFLPLNEVNRLEGYEAAFYRSYPCMQRRLKGWFSVIISVSVANYALIGVIYKLFIFFAGWFQKRRDAHTVSAFPKELRGGEFIGNICVRCSRVEDGEKSKRQWLELREQDLGADFHIDFSSNR